MYDELICDEEEGDVKYCYKDPVMLKNPKVLENMLMAEDAYIPANNYFQNQKDVKPYMRTMLVKWMLEVCEEQQREEEVYPHAVNLLDRVLSSYSICRTQLQLLASACMFLASKIREKCPLSSQKLVMYTDYSIDRNELVDMELLVLQFLKWDTSSVLPHDYLAPLLEALPLEDVHKNQILKHSQTFIALCCTNNVFIAQTPSVVACASICAASRGLLGQPWYENANLHSMLQKITSIEKECIRTCEEQIEQLLSQSLSGECDLTADVNNTEKSQGSQASTPTDVTAVTVLD